jgi:hypothetical protein
LKADDTEDETEKKSSKLKGVYWPGMDLFDSATAEMKRMRNQKKDGTVLQQMKRSSAGIEPTEWVFNANGEFRKVRDIFDESTESSPVSLSINSSYSEFSYCITRQTCNQITI